MNLGHWDLSFVIWDLYDYILANNVLLNQSEFCKLKTGQHTRHNQRKIGGTTMNVMIEQNGPV
ncbi:MAG: hypothetical protein ACYSW0_21355, partial [Planctomycetota bacterium]